MSAGTITPPVGTASAPAVRSRLAQPALLGVGALTILAALLRFTRLGHQGFWFDEGNTALLVHLSPGKMLGLIPQTESTPPLYYSAAWVWARVFGFGEVGLRSLSALAGVAVVPAAYAAGCRLLGARVGLLAAALAACNPLLIWYSQEARSYSLLVLLSTLSLAAFARARLEPSARNLGAWVLACALALATHYYALLAVAPQAIWLLAEHRRHRGTLVALGAVAMCGLALVPLALSQNATGHASWIAPIPLDPRLGQIEPQFLIGLGAPAYGVLEPLAAAMALVGLALVLLRSETRQRTTALWVGALGLGGLAINLLLVAVGIDDLITRNVLAVWPALALVLAAGFGARRAGLVGVAAAVVLCATGVAAAIGVTSDRSLQRPDWRVVAHALGPTPVPGSAGRVILLQHYRDLLPLSLYVPGLRFWPHHDSAETVQELDVVAIAAPRVKLCWWGAACNLSPTALQSTYALPGFHVLWRRAALQFTILRLVPDRAVRLSRAEISAALYATTLRRDGLLIQR